MLMRRIASNNGFVLLVRIVLMDRCILVLLVFMVLLKASPLPLVLVFVLLVSIVLKDLQIIQIILVVVLMYIVLKEVTLQFRFLMASFLGHYQLM